MSWSNEAAADGFIAITSQTKRKEKMMRKLAIVLLATAVSLPAAGAMAQNNNTSANPANQPSQTSQMNKQQPQANNSQDQNANQQQAQNQPIQPQDLSRSEIRQVQSALNKQGDNVGRVDGHWGPKTKDALNKFQQSKGIQANGQLTRQTMADLGLDAGQFNQQGNQSNGS